MRLLAICESPPTLDPRHGDGSTLISAELLARLGDDIEIDLVYFADRPVPPDKRVTDRCRSVVHLDVAPSSVGLISRLPRGTRIRFTRDSRRTIDRMQRDVDVAYLHSLHTFAFMRDLAVPVVVHEVDAWSLYLAERAQRSSGLRSLYDRGQARRTAALERATAATAARYLVVGAQDAEALSAATGRQIDVLANGVDTCMKPVPLVGDGNVVAFVGSLDYPPNVEAVFTLVRDVVPIVRREIPDVRVTVAGRKAPEAVLALAGDGVSVESDVADVVDVYARADVLAYPGSFGRGRKNTVIEAMGAGRPVVASTSAARGIERGPHIEIADGAEQMAHAIIALLRDRVRAADVGRLASAFVASLPTWDETAERFAEILRAAH